MLLFQSLLSILCESASQQFCKVRVAHPTSYGFSLLGILPERGGTSITDTQHFAIDYTFFLNLIFLILTGILAWLRFGGKKEGGQNHHHHHGGGNKSAVEKVLGVLAIASYIWLAGGLIVTWFA